MGRPRLELTGQRFSRLLVLAFANYDKRRNTFWLCLCDCGKQITVRGTALKIGRVASCGCYAREVSSKIHFKHGHRRRPDGKRSPTYRSYGAMKNRCYGETHPRYADYGGRGIQVCERWLESFENFLADMGERPTGKTLDRFPNKDGNYEPSNCRWATPKEQAANRRPRSRAGTPLDTRNAA